MHRRFSTLLLILALAACGDVQVDPDAGADAPQGMGTDAQTEPADAGAPDATPEPEEPAVLSIDRAYSDLGDVLVGGRSAQARFVVSNTGAAASGALSIATTGAGDQFDLDDGCSGVSLAAGGSCELEVTFAPTVAGDANATYRIESSPGGALQVRVDGTALEPGALRLDDTDHDFGSVSVGDDSAAKVFVVQNSGDVATGNLSVVLSDPDAFAILSDDCAGAPLAAAATCSIEVVYQPDAVGTATGSLTVNADPGGNAVAALGGVGTAHVTVDPIGSGAGTIVSTPSAIDCGATCEADFDSAAVSLRATPSAGSVFQGWGGDCAGGSLCSLDLTGDAAVTARFEALRALSVQLSGSGTGAVSSAPAGVNCPGDCSESFVHGSRVVLTATAGANSVFGAWTGCPSQAGNTCTINMTATTAVTARFDPVPRALAVTVDGPGAVTSSPAGIDCGSDCNETFGHGTSVTLTARPSANATFSQWTGCDSDSGTTCTVTMNTARNVTATFALQPRLLEIAVTGNGDGSLSSTPAGITCPGDCSQNYEHGTSVTLVASPGAGSSFGAWTNCPSPSGNACTVTMTAATRISARFDLVPRTLTVATDGPGTVTSSPGGIDCGNDCDQRYDHGTTVTLTATPSANATFVRWSGCDSASGATCTVTMNAARSVSAVFAWETRRLSTATTGRGSGSVTSVPTGISCPGDCTHNYAYGTVVTLTATADPNSSGFGAWTGCPMPSGNTCTVTMTAAADVSASFNLVQRQLSVATNGPGRVNSSTGGINCGRICSETLEHGTVVTLTATPNAGEYFIRWEGCQDATNPVCTLTMDRDRRVTANFGWSNRVLDVSHTGNGSGTVTSNPAGINCPNDCSEGYGYGAQITLTADPSASSSFGGWTGCDSVSGTTCTVSMYASRGVTAAFNAINHQLTVNRNGNGTGAVTSQPFGIDCGNDCRESYLQTTIVTLTASSGAGSLFAGWNGCDSVAGNECKVEMNAARTVTATFNQQVIAYNLTVEKSGFGFGTVTSSPAGINCGSDCSEDYAQGTSVRLTASAGRGSTFGGWSGGGCSGTLSSCTVTMNQSRQVKAIFNPILQ